MLRISHRLAARVRRGETLGELVLLSLGLHLTLCLSLLMMPPTQPPAGTPEPFSVDVAAEEGPAGAAPAQAAPTEATAAPSVPTPPVQQAETPPPPPPLSPPTPEPPPTPPPPEPTPPLIPTPPLPPPPVVEARPPRPTPAPPRRVAPRPVVSRAPVNPAGEPAHVEGAPAAGGPAHAADGQNVTGRASAANNGAAWMGKLRNWWDQKSFYPKEASQTNEGGNVRVRIVIAADGLVTSIEVVQGSGSSVLDAAAVAVFRNAHLPPFPPGTPPAPADVVVMLHYHPADNGG